MFAYETPIRLKDMKDIISMIQN